MKGTTNAQQNAVVDSSNSGDELTLTYADGTTKKHDLTTPAQAITVDSALSSTSTNPVQNKVVESAINNKQAALTATQMAAVDSGITAAKREQYDSMVSTGGQPNVIETVKVNNTALPVSGKEVNIDLTGYVIQSTVDDLSATVDTKANSADVYTKTQADNKIDEKVNAKVASVYRFKDSRTYAQLPSSGNVIGDVYNVTDAHDNVPAGTNYAWNGTAWDPLGGPVDLSPYAKSDDVYLKTTVDDTFYKKTDTVDNATNATKAIKDGSGNEITSTYATKTSVDTLTTTVETKVDKSDVVTSLTGSSDAKVPSEKAVYNAINNIQTVQFTLKVTYSGASDLSGIVVTATPTAGGSNAVSVQGTTNSEGVAHLNVRQNVTYKITSSKTNYVFGSEPEKTCAELTTEAAITCYVKPKVTVTVTDSSNAGLQNGREVKMSRSGDTQTATTNSSGVVTFYANAIGEYTFSITNVPDKATVKEVKKTLAANDDVSVELVISFGYGFVAVDIPTGANSALTGTYPDKITVNGQEVVNECYGRTPAKGAGDNFDMGGWAGHKLLEGIKPVSKDGSTWADLNTDASTWAANGASQDYFTEFPFQWLSITTSGSTTRIIFSDSDERPDETFQCYAHTKGCDTKSNEGIVAACASASRDAIMESNNNEYFANSFHIGCFGANGGESGIYSKKATTYTTSLAYNKFWVGANARGTDYDGFSAQQMTYIQALFLLLYRSKDSQAAHSRGLADASSKDTSNVALSTTAYGMAGSTTSARNAFFWIHDLWGNIYQFIGGMWNRAGSSSKLYYWLPRQANSRAFDNSSWNSTSSYAKQTSLGADLGVSCSDSGGYITQVVGNGLGGFFPKAQGGSTTGGWPDHGRVNYYSSRAYFPYVGGRYDSADYAGLFYCDVDGSSTGSNSYYGARLSYRGGRPKA